MEGRLEKKVKVSGMEKSVPSRRWWRRRLQSHLLSRKKERKGVNSQQPQQDQKEKNVLKLGGRGPLGFLGPDLPPQPGEAEVVEGRGKAADQVGTEVDEVLVRRLLAQVVGALGEAHRVGQEGGSFLLDGCQGGLQLLVLEDEGRRGREEEEEEQW